MVLGISLYTTRAVLENLGVVDYGVYIAINGAVGLLAFLSSAMSTGTQRFISIEIGRNDADAANLRFNAAASIHLIIAIIFLTIATLSGRFLLNEVLVLPPDRIEQSNLVLQFLVVVVVANILSVPSQAILNAHERMDLVAGISVLQALMSLALAIGLYYAESEKLVWYSVGLALINLCVFIFSNIASRNRYPNYYLRLDYLLNYTAIKSQLGFSVWNLFGSLASLSQNQGFSVLLNVFYGPKLNAAFGIAQQVFMQLTTLSATLTKAFAPQMVKSEGGGKRVRLIDLTYLASKYTYFLLFLVCMPLLSNSNFVLAFWLVEVPDLADEFLRLIVLVLLVNQITVSLIIAIQAVGKIALYQFVVGCILISALPISYFYFRLGLDPQFVLSIYLFIAALAGVMRVFFARELVGIIIYEWLRAVFIPIVSVSLWYVAIRSTIGFYIFQGQESLIAIASDVVICCVLVVAFGLSSSERSSVISFLANGFSIGR